MTAKSTSPNTPDNELPHSTGTVSLLGAIARV
jgi:hypothetical protein